MATAKEHLQLPEPSMPFARWFGQATVAAWAFGVQSFPPPWNGLAAILSPGIGYIFGHGMNYNLAKRADKQLREDREYQRKEVAAARERRLNDIDATIGRLNNQIEEAQKNMNAKRFVPEIKAQLADAHFQRMKLMDEAIYDRSTLKASEAKNQPPRLHARRSRVDESRPSGGRTPPTA
jgi:hypothetical protein